MVLSACGGGGDEAAPASSSIFPQPPVPTVSKPVEADVVFTNVPTIKSTAIQGQRSVEIAAFRAAWLPNTWKPVGQLVFENIHEDDAARLFDQETVQLVDGVGDLNNRLTNYSVRFEGRRLIIDFSYGWQAQESFPPQTFSIKGNVLATAPIGKKFSFKLVGVQMHDFGALSSGVVAGGEVNVIFVEGKELPLVSSPSSNVYYLDVGSSVQVVVKVVCPSGCMFTQLTFNTNGSVMSPGFIEQNGTASINGPFMYVGPGQNGTLYFSFMAVTPGQLWVNVIDMEFDVGGTKVSPIVQQSECNTILSRGCKGV